jgi:flagellar motor switch protein FliN/FliY
MKGSQMDPVTTTTETHETENKRARADIACLNDVEVELALEIGRQRMRIADVLRLGPGATIEFDKQAGEPLDLRINGRLIGRGEAIVIGDRYAIRLIELVGDGEGGSR